jgi:hypothetical protein
LNEDDKHAYITELQFLQRQIDFLNKANKANPLPSLERSIENLRGSQDKLYSALVYHGITAEEMHKIITEKSDKELVKSVIKLQKSIDTIEKQLVAPVLSFSERQSLEKSLVEKSLQYDANWDKIINSPNKNDLITKIEQAQTKNMQKSRKQDKSRDFSPTR